MRGLLYKESVLLKQYSRVWVCLLLFAVAFSVMSEDSSFILSMMAMFCIMLPLSSMALDEQADWGRYASALPVRRSQIVWSKYIMSLVCMGLGLVVGLVLMGVLRPLVFASKAWDWAEIGGQALLTGMFGLLLLSVMMPLLFWLGPEKGRFALIGAIFILMMPLFVWKEQVETWLPFLRTAGPFFVVALLLISVAVSIAIYRKKEF